MKSRPRRSRGRNPFARLRSCAEFFKHDAPNASCCLRSTDEEIESDPDAFDCDECQVADALEQLESDTVNQRAWQLYHQVVTRFTFETHTVTEALRAATVGMEPETVTDLLERFDVIFTTVNPPPERKE
jgi:hypothetical protein